MPVAGSKLKGFRSKQAAGPLQLDSAESVDGQYQNASASTSWEELQVPGEGALQGRIITPWKEP